MNKHFSKVIGLFFLGLLIIGCEEDPVEVIPSITESESVAVANLDNLSNDVEQTIEGVLYESFNSQAPPMIKNAESGSGDGCTPNITSVEEGDNFIVTVDFGDACENPINGRVLSGLITYTYDKSIVDIEAAIVAGTAVITGTFTDFYIDEIKVEGSHVLTISINSAFVPESKTDIDYTFTFEDGTSATQKGTKTRSFTEGYDTEYDLTDDVLSTTGSWVSVFKDGETFSSEIKTPLIRKENCNFFLSGTIEVTKNLKTGTLDYGDGTCDNLATFTNELGEVKNITLGEG